MFYRSKGKLHGWCKPCARPYNRLKFRCSKYKLTLEEVLFHLQKDKCYLCPRPLNRSSEKQFDHAPSTGKFRDILCVTCNNRMGGIDDKEWLARAIAYRDFHAEQHACL
jgi:hypothetical protein